MTQNLKQKDLALITSLILHEDILGGTIFQTFDRAYAIAEKFQYIYPHDFKWEGEDLKFDEAVILFTKQQIEISLDKFEKEIEEIERIEKDNTSMIKIGTEVKIIDNFYEHLGYVKDSIVKIIEHDEYGNYILSSGHCCSESEIEIIKTI